MFHSNVDNTFCFTGHLPGISCILTCFFGTLNTNYCIVLYCIVVDIYAIYIIGLTNVKLTYFLSCSSKNGVTLQKRAWYV